MTDVKKQKETYMSKVIELLSNTPEEIKKCVQSASGSE